VCAAVPGCDSVRQLEAALAYEEADADERDFSETLTGFQQFVPGECTYCNHCLRCPSYIDIGQTLRLLDLAQSGITPALQAAYDAMPASASDCRALAHECGACESRCPFGVPTAALIAEAAALFATS